ncbi:pyruvate kinase [Cladochytrium replicatum]|nr:pyruvate kinase [Cladochytrium replicatum]
MPLFTCLPFIYSGPKTQSVEALGKLIESGMNIARMNFSHGSHEYHAKTIANLRTYLASCKHPRIVGILLDTKGPEIRTGKLVGGTDAKLVAGSTFTFHNDQSRLGDATQVSTTYTTLAASVNPGDRILVDDGLIGMKVIAVDRDACEVTCVVENDGWLGETKGVNLPGITVDLPAITEKDAGDILFGVEQGVDFIAASFIRKASDVHEIRNLIKGSNIKIISKIESQEGLDNFDEILDASDGIMVARGDLGVEIPVEQVARYQKIMIRKCNAAGKPVVTATQMLESMIQNPRPTRAEATDVANAVLDGSDCVMLSGETAKGGHPYAAVEMMSRICREAEMDINYSEVYAAIRRSVQLPISISEAIASSAVKTSWDVHASLIICLTQTGNMARQITKYRPIAPVLAVTASPQVARQCQVLRGIYPIVVDRMTGTDNIIHKAMLWGVKMGMAQRGDPVVVTSGVLEEVSGTTNLMRVVKCIDFVVG